VVVRQALFHLSQERHLRSLVTNNDIARSMALRFVAGETLADAVAAVRAINERGMTATLDHLGENVTNPSEALEAADACCRSLDAIQAAGVQCNLSVKLTQLGLDIGRECALENLVRVLDHAKQSDTFVRIDMEGSDYVDRTLGVFEEVREQFANVGTVIQSYLYRSERDVRRLTEIGARIRLVKGAYLEPETVAYPRKVDVDASYVRLMRMLLDAGHYPAIATHDPAMIDATRRYAAAQNIDSSAFEFQMLYGIRRDLQDTLVASGYRMRIYVPYGTQWYPYFMRRLAERPANVMFVLGNIAREASRGRGGQTPGKPL
jgi:proline dehydrogenase